MVCSTILKSLVLVKLLFLGYLFLDIGSSYAMINISSKIRYRFCQFLEMMPMLIGVNTFTNMKILALNVFFDKLLQLDRPSIADSAYTSIFAVAVRFQN